MSAAQAIQTIRSIISEFGLATLERPLALCERLQAGDDLVDVAVFGRFKAGKSTFLNQVAGRPVLPVGVVPVTAIVTRLFYGPTEHAEVIFEDGRRVRLERDALGTLGEFISESRNPMNSKQVASVEVALPSLKSYAGLRFVDTPGTGSVFKHNTETSLGWLPEVGAALVAISVDPPLTAEDVELIRELRRFTPKIDILLTKADLLSPIDLAEVERFIQTQLKKEFGADFKVHPFSAGHAQDHLRKRLDETLLHPLGQAVRHGTARNDILSHRLKTLAAECASYLALAEKAATAADASRQRLLAQVNEELQLLSRQSSEIHVMRRELASLTRPALLRQFETRRPALEAKLAAELTSWLAVQSRNLWHLCEDYQSWHLARFKDELLKLSAVEYQAILALIEAGAATFSRAVGAFEGRLGANIEESLGVRFEKPRFEFEMPSPREPDVSVGRVFDTPIQILWFMIPMAVFRGVINRHFASQLPYEVEKNLARLASQWTVNVNRVIEDLAGQADQRMRDEAEAIQALLNGSAVRLEAIESARRRLQGLAGNLQ